MIRPRITINCRLINKVSLGNCLARHTQLSLHYIIRITVHAISKYYSMLLSRLITEEIFRDRMESSPIINVTGPCQESTSLPPIVYCISIKRGGRERLREWCVLEILASFIATLHLKALYPNKGFPSFAVRLDFPGYGYGYREKRVNSPASLQPPSCQKN